MILVHRICESCSRKFSFRHVAGEKMPATCPDCNLDRLMRSGRLD